MRIFIVTIFLISLHAIHAQSSFRISGNINGVHTGTAQLNFFEQGNAKALQTKIADGKFTFNGVLAEQQKLNIQFTSDQFTGETNFFADNESITINVDTAHPDMPIVKGSASQKLFEQYSGFVKPIDEKSMALNKTGVQLYFAGKLTERVKDSLFNVHDELDKEKRYTIARFAKQYPSSAVSSWAISTFFGFDPNVTELQQAFGFLSVKNQQGLYGKQITVIISDANKTAIGNKAENFSANDTNGNPISLSSFNGKYVFVDFWASWCGPCRAENPTVVNTFSKYHSDNFDILGVSLDVNRDAWTKAITNDKLEWTQISELKGWDSKVAGIYGLKGLPFNMLLDKNGVIIAKNLRGPALANKLKELL